MLESVVIVIALLVVVLLAFSDKLPFPRRSKNTGATLRDLLLARANDSISAEEFEAKQARLHAELLATPQARKNPWIRWGLPIILVSLAIGAYTFFGKRSNVAAPITSSISTPMMQNSAMPSPAMPNATTAKQSNAGGDLKVMVKRLATKLDQEPKNGEGWALLAHTYVELRQYSDAEAAFAKAAALIASDAKLLADWADAHVVAQGGKWDAQARDLVKRALSIDSKNLKALALAGSEAFARADYPQAIAHWKDMQAAAPANSMHAKLAQANIEEANAMLAGRKPGGVTPSKP